MPTIRVAAAFLLLLTVPAGAGEILGTCDLRFLGTSTLHDFAGTVRCLPFRAETETDAGGRRVLPLVEVKVPVGEMNTGNRDRDEEMRKMFGSDRFPEIRGTVRNVDIDGIRRAVEREGKAVFDLTLTIRNVERRIAAAVTNLRERGDDAGFDLEFPVSLSEFGLKAPTVLFIIRVGDRVSVKGNVLLKVSSN
jgi:hypothetical protein